MIKSSNSKRSIIVIAHNIRSSHNIGSLFRTCEGLGINKLILSGYSPYPPSIDDKRLPHEVTKVAKAIDKTALGADKHLKWSKISDLKSEVNILKKLGYEIVGLEQTPKSLEINNYKPANKLVIILGNEVSGLEDSVIKLTDKVIEIPMFGKKESFNVVQAAAMALFYLKTHA
jgi:tRNA G18 (ribose-2'-O)-methylase SpoU